jgi:hypothetical protein
VSQLVASDAFVLDGYLSNDEVNIVADEEADWLELQDALDLIEGTLQCYRERAPELIRAAADGLEIRSRTAQGPPRWRQEHVGGQEIFSSDDGKRIELCREDVLRWLAEFQSQPVQRVSPIEEGILLAIDALWSGNIPKGLRAKDRDLKILEWLKSNQKSAPRGLARAVQRVLAKHPRLRTAPVAERDGHI